jgi:hypothetical protein
MRKQKRSNDSLNYALTGHPTVYLEWDQYLSLESGRERFAASANQQDFVGNLDHMSFTSENCGACRLRH